MPKSSPDTVSDAYPLCGAFCSTSDTTAESKLKIGRPVPEKDATVTLALPKMSPTAFDRHITVVADVHDDVKHTPRSPPPPRSSAAVAVCSPTPKLRPDTVTDAYPLNGAFRQASEAAAASKLKIGLPVPDTAATVTLADLKMSANAFDRHATVVADVQEEVKHTPRSPSPPCSSAAVAVKSATPKSRPDTIRDAYPLRGAFWWLCEASAASKLRVNVDVPTVDPTVSRSSRSDATVELIIEPAEQRRLVADDHAEVEQAILDRDDVAV